MKKANTNNYIIHIKISGLNKWKDILVGKLKCINVTFVNDISHY